MVRPRVGADVGIAIREGWRGGGIGRRLMAAAEAWARERGAEQMTLDCHAANDAAIAFYDALGYRTVGHFMAKPLGTNGENT
jgi:GNAT superfamily N-acetyltransferase